MENTWHKKILMIILTIIISFLIELFIFNFNNFFKSSSIIKIENNVTKTNREINIKVNKYVSKLNIKYKVDKYIPVKIKYKYQDSYGKYYTKEKEDMFTEYIDVFSLVMNRKIKDITIKGEDLDKIDIKNIKIDSSIHLNSYRIIYILSCEILLITFFYYKKIDDKKLPHLYLITSTIICLLIVLVSPPTTSLTYDDQIHYANSYITLNSDERWNNADSLMENWRMYPHISFNTYEENVKLSNHLNKDMDKSNTIHNYQTKNIGYTFLSIVLYIGHKLKLPFTVYFKLAKIVNAFICCAVISFAIKKVKVGKKLLFVIGLMPTILFQFSQYTYDSVMIAFFTLSFAYLISAFVCREKIDKKWLTIFTISSLMSLLTKAIYVPILIIFFFVPNDRFENKKKEKIYKSFVLLILIFIAFSFMFPAASGSISGDNRVGGTSVTGQLKLILNDPVSYAKILYNSAHTFIISDLITSPFSSYAYLGQLTNNCTNICLITLLYLSFKDYGKCYIEKKYKFLITLVILTTTILIWTALYLSFNKVGVNTISGVQARYFIPFTFPFLLLFNKKGKNEVNNIVLILPVIVNLITIYNQILYPLYF